MRRAEEIACFIWLILAGALCLGAVRLKLGTPSEPASGFLPFWTGILLGLLALVHLFQISFRKPLNEEKETFGAEAHWKRGACVVGSLLIYALLLPRLGYLLTTFLLMAVLFSVYERKKWWLVGGASLLVIAVTYLVFHILLKVQFPLGFLGIG